MKKVDDLFLLLFAILIASGIAGKLGYLFLVRILIGLGAVLVLLVVLIQLGWMVPKYAETYKRWRNGEKPLDAISNVMRDAEEELRKPKDN
jgi:hypothetical protein